MAGFLRSAGRGEVGSPARGLLWLLNQPPLECFARVRGSSLVARRPSPGPGSPLT